MTTQTENDSDLEPGFTEPDYAELVEVQTEAPAEPEASATPAEASPSPEQPKASTPEAPAATPATPPEPAAPPVQPAAAAQPAPAAAPAPAQAQPPAPQVAPEVERANIEQMIAQIDEVLTKRYSYSPEEAAKLDDIQAKPSEYLAQFAARIHRQVFTDAVDSVVRQIPQLVQGVLSQTRASDAAEGAFFTRWPQLKGKDDVTLSAIRSFRTANPNVTDQAEIIEKAGALAMIMAGLNPLEAAQAAAPPPPAPTFIPPRPAGAGGSGPQPVQPGQRTYEEEVFDDMVKQHFGMK